VRVLLTGATGFVGRHLCAGLEQRGHDVVPLISPRATAARGVALDLADVEATARVLRDVGPDGVIHLAARARPAGLEAAQGLFDNNVGAARGVLEAVRLHARRARVIVASSSAVYGAVPAGDNPIVEQRQLRPVTPYGASKVAVEAVVSVYAGQGLDVVTVRPFNLLGPGLRPEFVAAKFAQQIARITAGVTDPVIETGPLDPVRDFTDVRDAVRAYVALLERRTGPGPFNLCSGIPRSIREVLRDMLAVAGVNATIRQRPQTGTPSGLDVPYQCGSRGALSGAVAWEPEIQWRETLRAVLTDWCARVGADVS
jgi:GDP-4-dehydro-6-deoxy-D-mannose reductase